MKNKKLASNIIVILVVFVAGFLLISRNIERTANSPHIKIAGQTLNVDLATTATAQSQGLSGREKLRDNQGMFFVFDRADRYPFWMKDMKFAIDIIWISEDKKVVYIERNALPESFPEVLGGKEVAKYVLEVNAGFADKHKLQVGDAVEI